MIQGKNGLPDTVVATLSPTTPSRAPTRAPTFSPTTSPVVAYKCSTCKPGQYISRICDPTRKQDVQCSDCGVCAVGSYVVQDCVGSISGLGQRTICAKCAVGTESLSKNQKACTPCPSGYTNHAEGQLCTDCTQGFFKDQGACVACGDIANCQAGQTSCSSLTVKHCASCDAGFNKVVPSQHSSDQCVPPTISPKRNPTISTAQPTMSPTFSSSAPTTTFTCHTCSPGEFEETACNLASRTQTVCRHCRVCHDNEILQTPCSSIADTVCQPCPLQPVATYSVGPNATSCTVCDKIVPGRCTSCPVGQFNSAGTTCSPCTAVSGCVAGHVTCTSGTSSTCDQCVTGKQRVQSSNGVNTYKCVDTSGPTASPTTTPTTSPTHNICTPFYEMYKTMGGSSWTYPEFKKGGTKWASSGKCE